MLVSRENTLRCGIKDDDEAIVNLFLPTAAILAVPPKFAQKYLNKSVILSKVKLLISNMQIKCNVSSLPKKALQNQ